MTRRSCATYSSNVPFPVNGAVRRLAAGAVLLVAVLLPIPSRPASSTFTIGDQSLLQVSAGKRSEVTIRAWNRPTIEYDTDDEAVQVVQRPVTFGTPQNPLSVAIPVQNIKVRDASGALVDSTLPPEDFPYASDFRSGVHPQIRIVTGEGSHVTVMVPASVAILDARIRGNGILTIDGYRGGTLFAVAFGGRMTLTDIASAVFAQPMHGRLLIADSTFERLRVRTNTAALVFEHDRARQIEVTSVSGPIVWDNGAFDSGLARFESATGAIGIGVANSAQIDARSGDGRVYGLWDKRTPLEMRGDNEASAIVDGGGPIVNAVSAHGNVYLYDGSLTTRRAIPPDWRRLNMTLRPPETGGAAAPGSDAFRRFRELRPSSARPVPLRRRVPPPA